MNKEFVPYTEAFELKQLGFDEPCFFAFDNCSTPMRCTDLRTGEQRFNGVNYNSSSYTSQPTFSQAFRWFREKHGLRIRNYGSINYSGGLSEYFEIFKYGHGTSDKSLSVEVGALTYEKAELACLRKLIELFKNK